MNWILSLGFVAAYLLLDAMSYIHPLAQSTITPWNPHPALAIALLMVRGQRWAWLVFVAVLTAEIVVRDASAGWPTTLLISSVLTLGYSAMAAALVSAHPLSAIETRSDMARLVGVVTVGSLITGALYVGALWAAGARLPGPYMEALLQFWVGDCVGILISLPVLLLLCSRQHRLQAKDLVRKPIAILQIASVGLALWLVFGPAFSQPFKFFYLLFLPLVWISMRFGLVGSTLATLAIQAGVIAAVQGAGYAALTVFELQALLIALTVTGLFLGVVVDERRRAAEELRTSLRLAAAAEMSAALAHELNQPLTALMNYARAGKLIASAPRADPERLGDVLDNVLVEATRAADVVRRLRDFFKTGATALQMSRLPEIAHHAVASLREKAQQLDVAVEEVVSESTPDVLVDPLQIEIVLRNLLANGLEAAAAAAAPRRVRIEIAAGAPGFVKALVRDSGPGISPALLERVFEPFWSSRASGMGMGLAISRAIVEAHGGKLWAETRGQGTFGLTLPVAP